MGMQFQTFRRRNLQYTFMGKKTSRDGNICGARQGMLIKPRKFLFQRIIFQNFRFLGDNSLDPIPLYLSRAGHSTVVSNGSLLREH